MQYKLDSFLRAQKSYGENTPIQAHMRKQLLKMLETHIKFHELNFPYIFEFGCGQCELTNLIANKVKYENYVCNDINEYELVELPPNTQIICFDMRDIIHTAIFNQRFHLILSNACLQWLPFEQTIRNLEHIIHKNGLLLIGTFGIDNYMEMRNITGIGLPYPTSKYMQKIINQSFECVLWHEEHIVLNFENPLDVFKHIRKSGANAMQTCYIKKSWLKKYAENYNNALTYHIVCFLARRL